MFAVFPRHEHPCDQTVAWHLGNVYALPEHPQSIALPHDLSDTHPTTFDLLISADYEIRLFGDPAVRGSSTPTSVIDVKVDLEARREVVLGDDHIVPYFVGGWALGDAFGIELTSLRGRWAVEEVACITLDIKLEIQGPRFLLASGQTRRLPLKLRQAVPFELDQFSLTITLIQLESTNTEPIPVHVKLPVERIPTLDVLLKTDLARKARLKMTYWAPHPSMALVLPPLSLPETFGPPILALHGAGVPLTSPFWPDALPRQDRSWMVVPAGGSAWGYDWRGSSLQDAFAALAALRARYTMDDGLVVIGHSNGGQGTFHLASRYPDLVHSAMPAAAYQSAPLYVPETWSHGERFVDPSLAAILRASTAGGDNERFLSNLVRTRMKVVHGGVDTNVPVYHSRASVQTIKSWDSDADIELMEVPGKDHWWDEVFSDPARSNAIRAFVETPPGPRLDDFTLTVLWPHESGSMGGWRILDTKVPGKFASLEVIHGNRCRTANALLLFYQPTQTTPDVSIDSQTFNVDGTLAPVVFEYSSADNIWKVSERDPTPVIRGPISRILTSVAPLTIVVSQDDLPVANIAVRLAWVLYTYLGLDTQILDDAEAIQKEIEGNAIVVTSGSSKNKYSQAVLSKEPSEFSFGAAGGFSIRSQDFKENGTGLLLMHGTRHLFMHGTDQSGLERAFRAFPVRTGTPNPEWMIIGPKGDVVSFGGILGAGFWSSEGGWSPEMSWVKNT